MLAIGPGWNAGAQNKIPRPKRTEYLLAWSVISAALEIEPSNARLRYLHLFRSGHSHCTLRSEPVPESLIAAQVREVVNIKGDAIRHAWHTLWEAGEAEAERWGKVAAVGLGR